MAAAPARPRQRGLSQAIEILQRIIDEWSEANGDWPEGSFPQDPVTALGSSSPVDSPPAQVYVKRVIREPKPRGRLNKSRMLRARCIRHTGPLESGYSQPGDRLGRRVNDHSGEELADRRCELEPMT